MHQLLDCSPHVQADLTLTSRRTRAARDRSFHDSHPPAQAPSGAPPPSRPPSTASQALLGWLQLAAPRPGTPGVLPTLLTTTRGIWIFSGPYSLCSLCSLRPGGPSRLHYFLLVMPLTLQGPLKCLPSLCDDSTLCLCLALETSVSSTLFFQSTNHVSFIFRAPVPSLGPESTQAHGRMYGEREGEEEGRKGREGEREGRNKGGGRREG